MSAPDVPSWQYRSDSDRHWHFNLSERVYAKEYAICKSVLCTKMEATPTFDSKPEEMNHFGDLKKTLKSSQGVKGLQILSFECESCPLVQVFLCLYKKGASSARVAITPQQGLFGGPLDLIC